MSEYLGEIIYLTQDQYNTLKTNGTVGTYTGLNNSNLYVTDSALGSESDITNIRAQLGLNILNPSQNKFLKDTGTWTAITWNDISNHPTNVSSFTNDAGYLTSFTETDPTVPSWAKAATKPAYTASEVGALSVNTIADYDTLGSVKPWYSHSVASTGPTAGSNSTAITVNAIQTTTNRYYAIEADSNGRLFVNVPWTNVNSSYQTTITFDGTYNASSNKAATVSTVTNKINALNVDNNSSGSGNHITGFSNTKTLQSLTQTNGIIYASFQDIAFPITTVAGVSPEDGSTNIPAASLLTALGLSSAMHYRGTVANDPTDTTPNGTYIAGDVVVYDESEYVYDGTNWREIGSESSFALSGHTHTTSITDNGTNSKELEADTTYTLNAGETSFSFTTPPNIDTKLRIFLSNIDTALPIVGLYSGDANAPYGSHDSGTKDVYGAIPSTAANRPTINPSTGEITVPGGITADIDGTATNITGIVTVAHGGTGITTIEPHKVLIGPNPSSGSTAAAPTWRVLAVEDIPGLTISANVHSDTTMWNLIGSSGTNGVTYKLVPFTERGSNARFYTGSNAPSGTTRLNYNGYLYATKLYSGGTEVSVSGHTHDYLSSISWDHSNRQLKQTVNATTTTSILEFVEGSNITLGNATAGKLTITGTANDAVTQTGVTDNQELSILLKGTTGTTDKTEGVKYSKSTNLLITANPNTGAITAPGGFLGNATTATTATNLAAAPTIAESDETNNVVSLFDNTTYVLTAGNKSVYFTTPNDTKVVQNLNTENKKFGILFSAYETSNNSIEKNTVSRTSDIYIHPSLSQMVAGQFTVHDKASPLNEKVTLQWNSTDQSLDFIFA